MEEKGTKQRDRPNFASMFCTTRCTDKTFWFSPTNAAKPMPEQQFLHRCRSPKFCSAEISTGYALLFHSILVGRSTIILPKEFPRRRIRGEFITKPRTREELFHRTFFQAKIPGEAAFRAMLGKSPEQCTWQPTASYSRRFAVRSACVTIRQTHVDWPRNCRIKFHIPRSFVEFQSGEVRSHGEP